MKKLSTSTSSRWLDNNQGGWSPTWGVEPESATYRDDLHVVQIREDSNGGWSEGIDLSVIPPGYYLARLGDDVYASPDGADLVAKYISHYVLPPVTAGDFWAQLRRSQYQLTRLGNVPDEFSQILFSDAETSPRTTLAVLAAWSGKEATNAVVTNPAACSFLLALLAAWSGYSCSQPDIRAYLQQKNRMFVRRSEIAEGDLCVCNTGSGFFSSVEWHASSLNRRERQ